MNEHLAARAAESFACFAVKSVGRPGLQVPGVARRLETGVCHMNDATINDEPQMPLGGSKASGWGRFGGTAALEEFTELRWITTQHSTRQYPI